MAASTASTLDTFLSDLAEKRSRLAELASGEGVDVEGPAAELVEEMSGLGEELLVAEEELRAQSEELASSQADLESLASRYQQMFVEAQAAYVITDGQGVVVARNRAADRLLDDADGRAPRVIASRFELRDRARVRTLTADADVQIGGSAQGARAWLRQAHGPSVAVQITVEAFNDEIDRARRLRWRIEPVPSTDRARLRAVPGTGPEQAQRPASAEALALRALAGMVRAELSSPLDRARDPQDALEAAVVLARDVVPGAEHSGASLVEGSAVRTVAATDQIVQMCDTVQSDLGEGPSLFPQERGEVLHIADLAADGRWPRFAVAAGQLGIGSVLVCGWSVSQRRRGALSLYAGRPGAFGETGALVAPALACRVSIAAYHADRVHNLQEAVGSRQVIGQATGILMERYKISGDAAFRILVDGSQRSHIKLRELAVQVTETGEDPRDLVQ